MSPFRNSPLRALAITHFTVDFFSGAMPILLAAQAAPLGLTQGQVGLVTLVYGLTSSLTQPLFGLLADSTRAPLLALGGLLWQLLFWGLAGLAGRFEVFLALVAAAGLGPGAFHPPGAGGVPRVSSREQRGASMSVFLLGGTSGYAFGPLVAGFVFSTLGPRGTMPMVVGAAVVVPVLFLALRNLRYEVLMAQSTGHDADDDGRAPKAARWSRGIAAGVSIMGVSMLALIILFRSWASSSLSTYLPQYFLEAGRNLVFAGNVLFVFSLAAAAGSFTAGFLADRVGRHRVIVFSLLGAVPLMYGLIHMNGIWMFVFGAGLGFCLSASLPLTLLIGQEIAPEHPGVMTGLTLGFTFVAGGIGTAVTGAAAEQVGLWIVLNWLPLLLLLGGLVAVALTGVQQARPQTLPVSGH